jgi:hypothetical protein
MKDCQADNLAMEQVSEIVDRMRRQEATTYRRSDYLTLDPTLEVEVADGTWRQRIIEWMYGVVDHCALRRDSVAVAAIFLDLCVERNLVESRREFQLAAMTALQLAIKLYDSTMVKLDSMVKLGRGQFQIQDVVEMERKLLAALQWRVHPPTSLCFLRQYMQLVPAGLVPHMTRYMLSEVTRFITEISVCLYKFVKYPPSAVAYATFVTAMERIGEAALPSWQRHDILARVTSVLDEDVVVGSPMMKEIYDLLQASLQKNVNLEHLLKTIEVQCGVAPTDTRCHNSKAVLRESEYYQNDPSGVRHHSPRDVVQ